MKPFDEELVSGSIVRSVWKLSWPIVLMNLINGVPGVVSQVLVGHYVAHHEANAAIGVAWTLFLLVVVSLASLFHGMGVLIAQYAGRQDRDSMGEVLYHTALCAFYIVVFIIGPIGYWLAPHVLSILSDEPEVRSFALPYLRVMFVFGAPLSFNFLMSTAMQSSGDPKTPLKLVILGVIFNVLFTTAFIAGAGPIPPMGPMGAALGTCLAPIPGLVIAVVLVSRGRLILQLPARMPLLPDWTVIKAVLRIGIPTAINGIVLNIGGLMLYVFIDRLDFSSQAMAAYTVCYSQLFSLVTWASMGLRAASAAFVGQNVGAGKSERGKAGVRVAATIGVLWACVWGMIMWMNSELLLSVFNLADPHVLVFGKSLLRYLSFSGIFLAAGLAFTGGLIGAGETQKPMWIAIVTQIFVLLGVCQIYAWLGLLSANAIWQAILISHFSRYVLTHIVFRRAKWKPIVLDIRASQQA